MYAVIVPTPGESITEVEIGSWQVEEGQYVEHNQLLAEIESDKATLELVADAAGVVHLLAAEGDTVAVGSTVAEIDTEATNPNPTTTNTVASTQKEDTEKKSVPEEIVDSKEALKTEERKPEHKHVKITPSAQALMDDHGVSLDDVLAGLSRIQKKDVTRAMNTAPQQDSIPEEPIASREEELVAMSPLRKKLSQRLVSVKNETAMLTTFNEINLHKIMEIRKQYQPAFLKKHGFKLGFMSLFTKAVSEALKHHPMIGASIDGDKIRIHHKHHISIAVQTPKGLMVPVVKDVDLKGIAQIEGEIKELATKARNKKISLDEMEGGIFTITNGGTFGSMMSTPIINPPQSAILGMHNIIERPIAEDGQVVIRPMMYVALSYDHRIIDGKDSVGFLVKLKKLLEEPTLLLSGISPYESLFDL
ncbi:2-oxoglutarate dehydrogenase complex dihydrolipoyllysine-residue succinyltransferase [Halosquirtibacter laminarini]|uniref:2-oxoglutarate dehydrogenase complex dihydrolipoyllysine-residue succinyltransferase n=1 Tax=Halosquirtibacter laminarini TaxID=3374600 RepID=A0AC61NFR6_9BACT|nr:2-oxoglutarate dehydrogenase complex dihydrolipoyllysine-residue succinyltransferase [Prolixibacteraceae bacterium]